MNLILKLVKNLFTISLQIFIIIIKEKISSPKQKTRRPKLIRGQTSQKIKIEVENDTFLTAIDLFKNKKINHNNVKLSIIEKSLTFL